MKNSCSLNNQNSQIYFSALVVHKPIGITSHTLTKRVARFLGISKAGHTGTLDKAASGLMIVLLGKATKFSRFFLSLDKEYRAVFALGVETTTLDSEGTETKSAIAPSEESFTKAFDSYKGVIEQRPPLYSAVHINGKRAWHYAKTNPTLIIPPRKVIIYNSQIILFDSSQHRAVCTFQVSSGTYIRSIVRDITEACNSYGHLQALQRTHIASINLNEAVTLDDIEMGNYKRSQFSPDILLRRVRKVDVVYSDNIKLRRALFYGISPEIITTRNESQIPVMLYDKEGFVGMWEFTCGTWKIVMHMADDHK